MLCKVFCHFIIIVSVRFSKISQSYRMPSLVPVVITSVLEDYTRSVSWCINLPILLWTYMAQSTIIDFYFHLSLQWKKKIMNIFSFCKCLFSLTILIRKAHYTQIFFEFGIRALAVARAVCFKNRFFFNVSKIDFFCVCVYLLAYANIINTSS